MLSKNYYLTSSKSTRSVQQLQKSKMNSSLLMDIDPTQKNENFYSPKARVERRHNHAMQKNMSEASLNYKFEK